MIRGFIVFAFALCFGVCQDRNIEWATVSLEDPSLFIPKDGDLLFQDINCGDFCDAITKVTHSYDDKHFSHIGIARRKGLTAQVEVLEAIYPVVHVVSLDNFLKRSNKVMVGRVKPEFQNLIPKALQFADTLMGKQYDDVFDINNDKYYCSELVYFAFKKANNGNDLFPLAPMTYVDPDTGETFPIWTRYFQNLGIEIPEGKPGINPGGISLSEKITMVHSYGGYNEDFLSHFLMEY